MAASNVHISRILVQLLVHIATFFFSEGYLDILQYMEEEEATFEKASLFLLDHTRALSVYVPIPGLLEMVKGYYCSELLFENALLPITAMWQGIYFARFLIESKNKAVQAYRDSVLQIRHRCEYTSFDGFTDTALLTTVFQTWTTVTCCGRPRCYWISCHCGWPLVSVHAESEITVRLSLENI